MVNAAKEGAGTRKSGAYLKNNINTEQRYVRTHHKTIQ